MLTLCKLHRKRGIDQFFFPIYFSTSRLPFLFLLFPSLFWTVERATATASAAASVFPSVCLWSLLFQSSGRHFTLKRWLSKTHRWREVRKSPHIFSLKNGELYFFALLLFCYARMWSTCTPPTAAAADFLPVFL